MNSANRDKALAQKAMDNLLVDLLIREQPFAAVRLTKISRLPGNRPCWYLWTEDNQGVYQLELQDVGQVHHGRPAGANHFLELEADFILHYFPFSEIVAVAASIQEFSAHEAVTKLAEGQKSDRKNHGGANQLAGKPAPCFFCRE